MQSEAGAAGALHGALKAGAFSTTFTASDEPARASVMFWRWLQIPNVVHMFCLDTIISFNMLSKEDTLCHHVASVSVYCFLCTFLGRVRSGIALDDPQHV